MFKSKLIKTTKHKTGSIEVRQITKNKNNEFITKDDIDRLKISLENKTDASNVMIRALNGIGWTTLKGFRDDYYDNDYEDYYNNKVADSDKFGKFFQLELTIRK